MSKIVKALEQAKRAREGETAPRVAPPAANSPTLTGEDLAVRPQAAEDVAPNRRHTLIGPPPGMLERRTSNWAHPDAPLGSTAGQLCPLAQFVDDRLAHLQRHRIMTFLGSQTVLDSYNFIRTQILERTRESGTKSIMVTSVNKGEGKTLTAINLALSISREAKHYSLLVEANLRHPSVANYLGITGSPLGLSDYLFNDLDIRSLFIDPGLGSPMRVILAGKPSAGSTDMLSVPKMHNLVQELKHRYTDRYIIFDGPHISNMPDALIFTSYVDGVILVVKARKTSRHDLEKAIKHVNSDKIIGIVLNDIPAA